MDTWFSGSGSKEEIRPFFEKKIAEIDSKIEKFKQTRKLLEGVLKDIDKGAC